MIRTDSTGALNNLKNPQITQRTKYIDVQHHVVRQRCARGEITLEFVTGEKNVVRQYRAGATLQATSGACIHLPEATSC
jgi:hypothetical protein